MYSVYIFYANYTFRRNDRIKIAFMDYVVFIVACAVFLYYFFFVAPIPVYWNPNDPTEILPRNAIFDAETGKWIVGWQYSLIKIIGPLICLLSFLMLTFGESMPRIRDMHLKDAFRNAFREKIKSTKKEMAEWKNRKT